MFRLEKVFQNDDKGFLLLTNIIKAFTIFGLIYIYARFQDVYNNAYTLLKQSYGIVNFYHFGYTFFVDLLWYKINSQTNRNFCVFQVGLGEEIDTVHASVDSHYQKTNPKTQ